jgi:hypothetical protein
VSLSGLIVLMLFGALLLALANRGWPGVRDWLHAKFIGTG